MRIPVSFLSAALIAAALSVAGCDRSPAPPAEPFQATDITGADFGTDFHLTDHTGKPRSMADFKGKVVALFFGYTHCPDACPTTMTELKIALGKLGPQARDVQVLFVTVDPGRDTPDVLSKYVPAFNPTFLGLSGTAAQLAEAQKAFKIVAQKVGGEGGGYTVDHSAGTYLFDRQGRLRLFVSYGAGAKVMEHDIRLLLQGPR
ncbi:SCO family protein [Chitinivorax sp. PXF-14]|uniref:SCO family protein n=1 Tax=Chitinivorax sp. PXF-14 TaxID=3230488 RepID=UPI0034671CEB